MSSPRDTIHSPTLANLSPENWPLLLLVNTYVVDRSVQIVRVNDLAVKDALATYTIYWKY